MSRGEARTGAIGPVLVVGGGIGGLTLAALLERRGVDVEVVERAPRFGTVGAGLMLGVNAMSVLREVGCAEELEAGGYVLTRGVVADRRGRVIFNLEGLGRQYGRSVAVHRARLHEALARHVGRTRLRMATSVASLVQEEGAVEAELTDGTRGRYALVVGADGINSAVRGIVAPGVEPSYAGYTCWRFVVPFVLDPPLTMELWGRGKRFGAVPIGAAETYCFSTANAPRGERDPEEGRLERFKALFADFGEFVPEVLRRLEDPAALFRDDIEEVALDRWVHGRVVLLGDAAHAMTPNLGQGAAMAVEDAYVLAELLAGRDSVEEALAEYERVRKPRVRAIADEARLLGLVGQWSSPLVCGARNRLLGLLPASVSRTRMERLLFDGAPALRSPAT